MTVNSEALELAVDIFCSQMQNEQKPDFSKCLEKAIALQCEEKPDRVETVTAAMRHWHIAAASKGVITRFSQ